MRSRDIRHIVEEALQERSVILLTGLPRVGRSTLARSFLEGEGHFLELDAAIASHRARIADGTATRDSRELILIDNIDQHSLDAVISLVRSAMEPSAPRFLLITRHLWSVARLAHELAGFVKIVELAPVQPYEAWAVTQPESEALGRLIAASPTAVVSDPSESSRLEKHWLRGGFPDSLLAADDGKSFRWRTDYLNALLSGDHSDWGIEPRDRLRDFFAGIVLHHGQIFDEDKCRSELGLDRSSVRRTGDMLGKIGLVRQLPNWTKGHPVLFIRDSGLFHAAARIGRLGDLRAHDLYGHSWQCFASEALILASGDKARASFYRDKRGDEIDLILDFGPGDERICAIEFKTDEGRDVETGFWRACKQVAATERLLVHSGSTSRNAAGVQVIPLLAAIERVQSMRGTQRRDAGIRPPNLDS